MVNKGEYIDYTIKISKIPNFIFSTEMGIIIDLCEKMKELELKIIGLEKKYSE